MQTILGRRKLTGGTAVGETGLGAAEAGSGREGGEAPFLRVSMSVEEKSRTPEVRLHMQAMDVCLDDVFVNDLLRVQRRAAAAWQAPCLRGSLRGRWTHSDPGAAGSPSATPSLSPSLSPSSASPAALSPRSLEFSLSPRNVSLSRAGRCRSLRRSDAPRELFPAGGMQAQRVAMRVSFVTDGLGVTGLDAGGNAILQMEMSEVDLTVERRGDQSSRLAGSMVGLHITDAFAQGSLHNRPVTVDRTTEKMVTLEMSAYDFFSISYPGYDRHVAVTICRPEITLLFRTFKQLRQYLALFGMPDSEEESSQAPEPAAAAAAAAAAAEEEDSAAPGGACTQQATAAGATRVSIQLEHPVLVLPRASWAQERLIVDLGVIQVQNLHAAASTGEASPAADDWHVSWKKVRACGLWLVACGLCSMKGVTCTLGLAILDL